MFGNRGFSPYGLGAVAKTGINWSSLLSNTQKTLGIINQAIPAFYQIRPIFNNMKTMFKVVNEMNKDDSNTKKTNNQQTQYTNTTNNVQSSTNTNIDTNNYDNNIISDYNDEGPSFFI